DAVRHEYAPVAHVAEPAWQHSHLRPFPDPTPDPCLLYAQLASRSVDDNVDALHDKWSNHQLPATSHPAPPGLAARQQYGESHGYRLAPPQLQARYGLGILELNEQDAHHLQQLKFWVTFLLGSYIVHLYSMDVSF